jgi:Fur family ferric uptake transcriptional regulator
LSRNTAQREAIRRSLQEAGRPLSAVEVLEMAQRDVPGLGVATVYRTIKNLIEDGTLIAVPLPGSSDRYEHRDAASHHHHHFICNDCGRAFDVPGCTLPAQGMVPPGFVVSGHDVVLYGRCDRCNLGPDRP